jgi:hypothetical protein
MRQRVLYLFTLKKEVRKPPTTIIAPEDDRNFERTQATPREAFPSAD